MTNKKNICSCKDDNYNTTSTSSFYLFRRFNNRFAVKNINPRTDIITNKSGFLNTNRQNNDSCAKPWRTPYNHYRKTYLCDNTCLTNEKIVKNVNSDSSDAECGCRRNYASTRLVNKVGIRLIQSSSNKNYLQDRKKLYKYNAQGILRENKLNNNTYKIGNVNGTVKNLNSNTVQNDNCNISYIIPESTTEITFQYSNSYTTIKKDLNPYYNKTGSVSQRNRINKLRYDTISAAQATIKDDYNNCINGEDCSKYVNPGPNTKKFTGLRICKPRRLANMRQTCP